MIDPKQPPPGWVPAISDGYSYCPDMHATTPEAHRIYAAESRPAVIDFAERITSWLHGGHSYAFQEWMELEEVRPDFQTWAVAQIIAAANGERTLP